MTPAPASSPLRPTGLWADIVRATADAPMGMAELFHHLPRADRSRARQKNRIHRALRSMRRLGFIAEGKGIQATPDAVAQVQGSSDAGDAALADQGGAR